ncbi:MAG: DNA replication/repair protein RecF [Bacteroidales bacterium]|jgi:DNA replication and repair protein RecF|nr:DNA replication/repair protein RecF [Bacteroidales bacterium]
MYLKKLSLTNFKNYRQAELEFSPRINCIVGNNGVGKTNILDAIHYLSLTKSFFNPIDSISIKHDEEFFIIQGFFMKNGEEDNIFCSFHRQKQKTLRNNGKEYERLSDHVGRFPVVMISPADSALIAGGSDERRKFMNKIISQYNPSYLDSVLNYNKALQQRNRLLKDFGFYRNFDLDMLTVWDAQLVRFGAYAFSERDKLIAEMVPVFCEYYALVANENEIVKLVYKSQLSQGDPAELLMTTVEKDRSLEYTTTGIHKDDLLFELNGYPVRSLGSQGQQKSYLVALKLAKFDYIKKKAGFAPILLLDDIFDKFDSDRVAHIIRLVGNHRFGQIFITDTHQERLQEILDTVDTDYKLFRISEEGIGEIVQNGIRKG